MTIFLEAGTVSSFGSSATAMNFMKSILGGIMYISIPFIGLALVYAGFMFIMARGNTEKVKTATLNITYIVVAIVLILGAYAIADIAYTTIIVNILGWSR